MISLKKLRFTIGLVICFLALLSFVSFVNAQKNDPSVVTFAQEPNSELSELLKYQKYQVEAKDPGTAAMLGGVFGFGLGHYYGGNGNFGQFFTVSELVCPLIMIVGAFNTDETEISDTGKGLIGLGAVALVIIRIVEPYSAYSIAVQHNQKLLDKYDIDLSLSQMDKGFKLTYRF